MREISDICKLNFRNVQKYAHQYDRNIADKEINKEDYPVLGGYIDIIRLLPPTILIYSSMTDLLRGKRATSERNHRKIPSTTKIMRFGKGLGKSTFYDKSGISHKTS